MRPLTASSRTRALLTHLAAGVLGAIVGITFLYCLVVWVRHTWAEWAVVAADQEYNAGNEDEAIFLLSQIAAKDPDYYEPFMHLGRIYSKRGNEELALEMYKLALKVFGREKPPLLSESLVRREGESIRENISALQKHLDDEHRSHQNK